jgi:hypothetical protein
MIPNAHSAFTTNREMNTIHRSILANEECGGLFAQKSFEGVISCNDCVRPNSHIGRQFGLRPRVGWRVR